MIYFTSEGELVLILKKEYVYLFISIFLGRRRPD